MFFTNQCHKTTLPLLNNLLISHSRQYGRKVVCSVNHEYFNKWTPENAYIFGYLCADGCVTKPATSTKFNVAFQSSCTEGDYISNLANKMGSNYKIRLKKDRKHCGYATVIYSHQMALDLISKGCVPRKSEKLQWPQSIPIDNIPILSNFILGYFDGDGCTNYFQGYLRIMFTGTHHFLSNLQQVLQQTVFMNGKGNLSPKTNSDICHQLAFVGSPTPIAIHNFMYKHANFDLILQRKYKLGEFFKSVSHLLPKERIIKCQEFKQSDEYQKLITCQIPQHICPCNHKNIFYPKYNKQT